MSSTESTGTRDVTYDLISVVYHALQGAETYQMYEQDAQQEGDQEAAALFHEAHQSSRQWADRAKTLLGQRMNQGGSGG
jgi:rubrerythrin